MRYRSIRVIACVVFGNVIGLISEPASAEWYRAERSDSVLVYTPTKVRTGALLSIECRAGETSVTVYWHQRMAGGHSQVVTYQIDGQRRRAEQWRLSTGAHTIGVWGAGAILLASRLLGKTKIVVRALNVRGGSVTAEFDVSGLERAIVPVARSCRWSR